MTVNQRKKLEKRAIRIVTEFYGKSRPVPTYTIEKKQRDEDGYFEDGPYLVYTTKNRFVHENFELGEHLYWFDDYKEAVNFALKIKDE